MNLMRVKFPTIIKLSTEPFHPRRKEKFYFNPKGKSNSAAVSIKLRDIYKTKLLPLEEATLFHELLSPKLYDADFENKPFVLLMGQYSTGKTSLLRYILQEDFPGMRIGPEPTTDRFIAIMHGKKAGMIPGNALAADASKPFGPLAKHGNAFLTKFQCSLLPSPVLEGLNLIDTPGILSGEKQRLDRGYDFASVLQWFAERVDRIVLLFDANKLDISDEFRNAIEAIRGNEEKVRIILNKSDSLDVSALMRVYGSLMWSLGKVLKTPEVSRVYVGSFWDRPYVFSDMRKLFEEEEKEFLTDLQNLQSESLLRKINDISKRTRLVKVHTHIMTSLQQKMPRFFGAEDSKQKMISDLGKIYEEIQERLQITHGDFPPLSKMQDGLRKLNFKRLSAPKQGLLGAADEIDGMIAALMDEMYSSDTDIKKPQDGVFEHFRDNSTPFAMDFGEGFDAGRGEAGWVVAATRDAADAVFDKLVPSGDVMGRSAAKTELIKSGLPSGILGQIYALADVDKDGLLNRDEFALAQYIVQLKMQGYDLPSALPPHLVPPGNTPQSS